MRCNPVSGRCSEYQLLKALRSAAGEGLKITLIIRWQEKADG